MAGCLTIGRETALTSPFGVDGVSPSDQHPLSADHEIRLKISERVTGIEPALSAWEMCYQSINWPNSVAWSGHERPDANPG